MNGSERVPEQSPEIAALTIPEQDALILALLPPDADCAHNFAPLFAVVERIVTLRLREQDDSVRGSLAEIGHLKAAQRELVALGVHYVEAGRVLTGVQRAYVESVNAALKPSDPTWHAHTACARMYQNGVVHYSCGISVESGQYEGGVYAEHLRLAEAADVTTRPGQDGAS